MFCEECGSEMKDTAKFCMKCGAVNPAAAAAASAQQPGMPQNMYASPPMQPGAYAPPPMQSMPQNMYAPPMGYGPMHCFKCGQNLDGQAVVCLNCGEPTPNAANREFLKYFDMPDPNLLVLSIFIPIVGICVGIYNIYKGMKESGRAYIIYSVISWIVYAVLYYMQSMR